MFETKLMPMIQQYSYNEAIELIRLRDPLELLLGSVIMWDCQFLIHVVVLGILRRKDQSAVHEGPQRTRSLEEHNLDLHSKHAYINYWS